MENVESPINNQINTGAKNEITENAAPEIRSFKFKAKALSTIDILYNRLSTLQVFNVAESSNNSVILSKVDSRDIQKRPFLFFIVTFTTDNIVVYYSISKDTSEKLRKLYVLKNLTSIISLITDIYQVDTNEFFQYLDSAIDDVLNSLSQSYSVLFNNYEALLMEERELRRLNIDLSNSNKALTAIATKLTAENEELKGKLKVLENYSDESLMIMIQEWLETHDNTIDIEAFANTYKVLSSKIEDVLNKMVAKGYLEMKE
ncbi:MAG: hypothetical protein QXD11_01345 [Candidatus Micrarchaeaceae archaeon]